MNPLSIFRHAAASHTASPFEASAAQTQGKGAAVTRQAASSQGTSGSSGTNTSDSSSAAITANDFLTLLVTEIQNQDPTSQTDPMTYITQLVGVNSLEQLVQINQTLTTATTPVSASSESGTPEARSAAAHAAIQAAQTTGPAAGNGAHLLPLTAIGQASTASTNAVAQAFTHPAAMSQQTASPTEVPLNPDVMRALQRSIPGAKQVGPSAGTQ